MTASKEHKPKQSRVINYKKNTSCVLMKHKNKQQGVKNSWKIIATSAFIENHVGNYSIAEDIAKKRKIPVSHVIDSSNLQTLCDEVDSRIAKKDHGPTAINPLTGNNQYYTTKKYNIYQTKYANGKIKRTRNINSSFFMMHLCH